jgi:hypothetical protein
MRHMLIASLLVIRLMALPSAAQAETAVGSAAAVRNDVRGSVVGRMSTGSPVHQRETVSAGVDSSAQLLFRDKTSLTLGPNSRVTIDKFVYDPRSGAGEVAVNLLKGGLRFISGSQNPENYSVRTPLASMGMRGSVAEAFVSELGIEIFVCIQGPIEVCALQKCRQLTTGQSVTVSPGGAISPPSTFVGPMLSLTNSVAFLQTYISTIVLPGKDLLPRFRSSNDVFDTQCSGEGCAAGPGPGQGFPP